MQFELNTFKVQRLLDAISVEINSDNSIEAKKQFEQLMDACYSVGNIHICKALLLEKQGLLTESAQEYCKALEFQHSNYKLACRIGEIYFHCHLFSKAESYFRLALKHSKNDVLALLGFANCKYSLGDMEIALVYYKKVLLQDGNNHKALYGISRALLFTNEIEQSMSYARKAIECGADKELMNKVMNEIDTQKNEEHLKQSFVSLAKRPDLTFVIGDQEVYQTVQSA